MREIKFRGWWGDPEILGEFGLCDSRVDAVSLKDDEFYKCEITDADAIMQYTGLKDKNGKEIHEGDIVKHEMHSSFSFHVHFKPDRGGWYPFASGDGCGCCSLWTFDPTYVEVVGNIYENPDIKLEED